MAEKPARKEINQKEMLTKAFSAQWQTTFDAINDAVCLLDMNGKILRCNKAMESFLKKSSKEIIGGTCWELVHGTDKPVKECPIVRMKKTLCRETLILEVDDKWLNVAVDPVLDETGNLASAVYIISDITQRKHVEQSFQETEAELKHIIEVVPGIIAKVNAHTGYFTYCNPALSSLLGFSPGEFLARPFIEFVHPDDRQGTINEVEKQLKGSPLDMFENRYICKNGSYKWLEWKATAADKKEVIYAAATDITERKQAEEKIRLHAAMMDNVAEGIYLIGLDDLLIKWTNEKFERMFGYDPGEMVGKQVDIVNAPTERTPAETRISIVNVLKETGEWHGEIRNIKRDRTHFWCYANISLFDHPEYGRVIVSVHTDITEHKKADAALRESEKRLKTTLNSIQTGIVVIDAETHIIVDANPAAIRMIGVPKEQVIGHVCHDYICPAEKGKCPITDLGQKLDNSEHILLTANREKVSILKTVTTIFLDGKECLLNSFIDIREKKKLEAQLAQSQKMEAIGTLAGGIAHDFNNLLTVISGNAQLALMEAGKNGPLYEEIKEIKKAGDKATSLTRQLLAFSRKQIIKPEVIDLNKMVNETEKMLKRMIGEDIEFLSVLEPDLWKVYADSGQINQIIMNMVINVRDAMFTCADSAAGRPQGGKLTIETANVELNDTYFRDRGVESAPGPYVLLAVSDTGSGMSPETREHIFEPFFTTKEVGKGTGLGLSTVYGIVKQNNGFIWIYSEPGHGSTFKVYLPKVKGDAELEEKEQSPVDDTGGSETVLIVEDNDGLRKLAQEILLGYGYRVLVAENGEDALRVSKEHEGPIHLLLTDVVMPKMGGKKLAHRLQPLYPQMKMIYMSGYTDDTIVHHGVLSPKLNFIQKPFTPESLARKVKKTIESEK